MGVYSSINDEYGSIIYEKFIYTLLYYYEYIKSYNRLSASKRCQLKEEYNNFIMSYSNYKKMINYLLVNGWRLNYDDALGSYDMISDDYDEIFIYFYELLQSFIISDQMKLDYKFVVPKDKPSFIEDINKYISYAKGFSEDRLCSFLCENYVYDLDLFDDVYKNVKVIDCGYDDYYVYSGINEEDKVCVPRIRDDLSTLINIHELVHKALLIKKDEIQDKRIVMTEVLPIFYEMLYKKENKFCKCSIHNNELSKILYKSYNNEPFDEQINKLKGLLNK